MLFNATSPNFQISHAAYSASGAPACGRVADFQIDACAMAFQRIASGFKRCFGQITAALKTRFAVKGQIGQDASGALARGTEWLILKTMPWHRLNGL